MAVSKRLRYEVLRRDEFACRYCGETSKTTELTIDHVVPKSLGGQDVAENLVTCCKDCNAGKSSSQPDAEFVRQVEEDAFEWKRAVKEGLRHGRDRGDSAYVRAVIAAVDDRWTEFKHPDGSTVDRPLEWADSVKVWLAVLTVGELHDEEFVNLAARVILKAIDPAMHKDFTGDDDPNPGPHRRWRYFCGIVWTEIRERQEKVRPEPSPPSPADDRYRQRLAYAHNRMREWDAANPEDHWEQNLYEEHLAERATMIDHFVHDDHGMTWCDGCDDPFCSHLYVYRLRKGYV